MSGMIVLVMGVSGAGKSTIGRALADALEAAFLEADAFHSPANIAKMKSGIPLTDADRWPWLDAIGAALDRSVMKGGKVVLACSALKQAYRDRLLKDGETFKLGSIEAKAMHTPGHTPACMTYLIGDAGFVGDTLFMPDYGTARCDFPGGDARILYRSIQKIFALPESTRLFMCHDYLPTGRTAYVWETTVGAEKHNNIHVGAGKSEDEFVAMRKARDAKLDMPRLILPSVQVNMRAGHMPPAEDNGVSYLKLPLNAL